jgi:maleate isomerase|tara:strand:- start:5773 stop:6615 length:843 start_codon:yes stop_codon:yes gene_type:complete
MEVEMSSSIGMAQVSSSETVRSAIREVQYDEGTHWRAKLGFIILSTDLVGEENIFRLAPEGVGTSITRLRTENDCTVANLALHIDGMAEAASILQPEARPDVVCYVCTSGSIVNGEDRVMAEIKRGAPWAQPTTLVSGVVNALRRLEAHRIVVATPYLDEVNTMEAVFLQQKGFEVLDIQGLNIEDGEAMGRISPSYIRDFALSIDRDDADAIFVSCGGIRTLDVLQEIEDAAQKPVVCSTQGMMWDCLRRAGITDAIDGYGRLFTLDWIDESPANVAQG